MLITVGSHHIEHDKLMLEYHSIGLVIHKAQLGTTSPDIISIRCPIAVKPVPVFIQHCLAEGLEGRLCFDFFLK
jgi:hypothetical protein